jgi:hypothetical protein
MHGFHSQAEIVRAPLLIWRNCFHWNLNYQTWNLLSITFCFDHAGGRPGRYRWFWWERHALGCRWTFKTSTIGSIGRSGCCYVVMHDKRPVVLGSDTGRHQVGGVSCLCGGECVVGQPALHCRVLRSWICRCRHLCKHVQTPAWGPLQSASSRRRLAACARDSEEIGHLLRQSVLLMLLGKKV